jgi:hemolysin III
MHLQLPSERVNFWTHYVGFLVWMPFTAFLMAVSAGIVHLNPAFWPLGLTGPASPPRFDLIVVSLVYGLGVLFLFFCSAWYHKNKRAENEQSLWRTLDHFAIFVMIAASYTPVVWIWFSEPWRTVTLVFQWTVTLAGLGFKVFVKTAPRWVDPVLYLLMGWVAVLAIVPLYQSMPLLVFFDLLWGGVWYTVGAVIYALKKPTLKPGVFGFHELFHVFILGGAASHASMVLRSLIASVG